jgi:deoxyribodipyrimidine photo-lyase
MRLLDGSAPTNLPPLHTPADATAAAMLDDAGGETVALARLRHYLWDTDAVSTYFDTRNGMLGADYSTKFAPWLAAGCLSPRTIYHQLKK